MSTHFVAELKVTKVLKNEGRSGGTAQNDKREIGEVTHITLRGADLDSLKTKIVMHTNLIDDDGVELT